MAKEIDFSPGTPAGVLMDSVAQQMAAVYKALGVEQSNYEAYIKRILDSDVTKPTSQFPDGQNAREFFDVAGMSEAELEECMAGLERDWGYIDPVKGGELYSACENELNWRNEQHDAQARARMLADERDKNRETPDEALGFLKELLEGFK